MSLRGKVTAEAINSIGTKAFVGLGVAGYLGHQAVQGFNEDNRITRGMSELTLGDPEAIPEITGRNVGITGLTLAGTAMNGPNGATGVATGAMTGAATGLAGLGIMAKSKSLKGKFFGGLILGMSTVGYGAGYAVGKYAPAFSTGMVNSTTVSDYNRQKRSKMPTVPGDVVLGMYNTRLA